jgi:capsular exopolysaccharide synthesis family protein
LRRASDVRFPAAVYGISLRLPKTYEASATLLVQPTSTGSVVFAQQSTPGASNAEETVTLTQTTVVARRAARILGRPPARGRALLEEIRVSPTNPAETKGNFLTIAVQNSHPARAAQIANAFATAVAKIRTASAVDNIDNTIATLRHTRRDHESETSEEALATQIQQLRGLKASQAGTTTVVERAVPATSPYSPKPLRNALLALLVALLIAAGLVPLLDRLDRRLRDTDELEGLIESPLLATIPDAAFPGHLPDWHVREAFQTLRAGLTYFNVDRPLSTLVVTSPAQGDGKTTVAVNLAVAYALDGQDVILLDADLRRPQAAGRLGAQPAIGLESVLAGERAPGEALIEINAGGGRLRVLPGAVPPPNPTALLSSERMRSLLDELSRQCDIVVIDTPALLAVSDAMPLINQAGGSVLVARLNRTTMDAVQRASQVIDAAGGQVLGTVATGVRASETYGYYGYYSYNSGDKGEEGAAQSANGSGGPAPNLAPEGAGASPSAESPA